jgi:hypothetical protein
LLSQLQPLLASLRAAGQLPAMGDPNEAQHPEALQFMDWLRKRAGLPTRLDLAGGV